MASNIPWSVVDIEAYLCLKQASAHWLINFSDQNGVQASHPAAIGACEAHFNFWGLVPNQALWVVIHQIAASIDASH